MTNEQALIKFASIQPILFGRFIQNDGKIIIISRHKKIIFQKILNREKKLLVSIFSLCDGINTTKNIISKICPLGYNTKEVANLLEQLMAQKVLVDSREIYLQFHPYLNNLTPFYHKLTKKKIKSLVKKIDEFKYDGKPIILQPTENSDFCKLVSKRRTIREFDKRKAISFQTFSELLYTAYGVSKKTSADGGKILKRVVPSAGALYPLHTYCIVWGKIEHVSPGLYYLNKKNSECSIVKLKEMSSYDEVMELVANSKDMIQKVSFLLVIVCNFKRITQKYANRGYLYGLLEAGHVAQNIYLYCTEQNLAVVEIGGFNDTELSKFLKLNYPEVAPVVCFLIGASRRRT